MKRVITFILPLICVYSLSAQVLYFEDFNGTAFVAPAISVTNTVTGGPMTTYNLDGNTPDASVSYVTDAWVLREDFANNTADTAAFSTSYYNPAGQSDDWMVTPQIAIPNTGAPVTLSWDALTYDPAFPDGYEVYVSTGGNTPADFLMNAPVFSIVAENTIWTSRVLSLNSYVNQDIYIAFRNNSVDEFLLLIDDIEVSVSQGVDLELTSIDRPSDYFVSNLNQIRGCGYDHGATVTNLGLTATNVFVKCNVYKNSDSVLVSSFNSDTIMNLPSSSSADVTFTDSFAPVDSGIYIFEYIGCMSENDTINSNDTIVVPFVVSANFMARDVNILNGTIGIGSGATGIFGMNYELKNRDQLVGITTYFNAPPLGQTIRYYVYSTDTSGMPGTVIDSTEEHTFTTSDSFSFLTLDFPTAVDLDSGTYFMALEERGSNVTCGYSNNYFTPNTAWVTWPTAPVQPWGTFEGYAFSIALIMRPIFNPCVENWDLHYVIGGFEDDLKYEANTNITSTDLIQSGAGPVLYDAGMNIDLMAGFEVELGAELEAVIDGCGGARFKKSGDMLNPMLPREISSHPIDLSGIRNKEAPPSLRMK